MIILEGPNGTGKTTLLNALLKEASNQGIWMTGCKFSNIPSSKTEFDMQVLHTLQLRSLPVIQDRVPWISDLVYADLNSARDPYITRDESVYLCRNILFIYCDCDIRQPKDPMHNKDIDIIRQRYWSVLKSINYALYDMRQSSKKDIAKEIIEAIKELY